MSHLCEACQYEACSGERFCVECGHKLGAPAPRPAAPAPVRPAAKPSRRCTKCGSLTAGPSATWCDRCIDAAMAQQKRQQAAASAPSLSHWPNTDFLSAARRLAAEKKIPVYQAMSELAQREPELHQRYVESAPPIRSRDRNAIGMEYDGFARAR